MTAFRNAVLEELLRPTNVQRFLFDKDVSIQSYQRLEVAQDGTYRVVNDDGVQTQSGKMFVRDDVLIEETVTELERRIYKLREQIIRAGLTPLEN